MPPSNIRLSPGQASERTGLSLDTLRYYERAGLIGPIERASGRRAYTEDDLVWIGIVTCLRNAGLGIADLNNFARLLREEGTGPQERTAFLARRRDELCERLRVTEAALRVLDEKIAHYG